MIREGDARLTSYVVGELDDEEALAVEQAMAEMPSLRDEIEDIRATAELLTRALAPGAEVGLRPEQRQTIERQAQEETGPQSRRPLWAWAGLAAVLLLGTAVLVWMRRPPAGEDRMVSAPQLPLPSAAPPAPPEPRPVPGPSLAPPKAEPTPPKPEPPPREARRRPVILEGVVKDQAGAVLPGATIVARVAATGGEVSAHSDQQGRFRLTELPAGPLQLRAELTGFGTTRAEMAPAPGSNVSWTPVLGVTSVAETLTVTAAAPVVTPTNSANEYVPPDKSPAISEFSSVMTARPLAALALSRQELPVEGFNTESYAFRADSAFVEVARHPLSTFSLDVDTASYSNVRRFLRQQARPPADAVRIEEMVNYFPYDYAPPRGKDVFAAHLEVGPAPWKAGHRLLRIGLKAREIAAAQRPPVNLVFLVDVSGSMATPQKLPLVKSALAMLVDQLTEDDRVAVVVYAGAAGLVLPSTTGAERETIRRALERLEAGGSTNGGQGIRLAYDTAASHFVKGGVNRVVLATDGDFNVGVTDQGSLVRLVQDRAKEGVFLSVLGFGMANYKDSTLELLADKGNGNYAYIDTVAEARKALVEQMTGTLVTVAKDVKIQVEFNPAQVAAYRLVGYENRLLHDEDFADDTKDAGEVGAGHTVTALYEIVPVGARDAAPGPETLRYQEPRRPTSVARSGELVRLNLRYKTPDGSKSRLKEWTVTDKNAALDRASADFRFAAAVAGFAMILRDSPHRGDATLDAVRDLAESSLGRDAGGYRAEFLELVGKVEALRPQ